MTTFTKTSNPGWNEQDARSEFLKTAPAGTPVYYQTYVGYTGSKKIVKIGTVVRQTKTQVIVNIDGIEKRFRFNGYAYSAHDHGRIRPLADDETVDSIRAEIDAAKEKERKEKEEIERKERERWQAAWNRNRDAFEGRTVIKTANGEIGIFDYTNDYGEIVTAIITLTEEPDPWTDGKRYAIYSGTFDGTSFGSRSTYWAASIPEVVGTFCQH